MNQDSATGVTCVVVLCRAQAFSFGSLSRIDVVLHSKGINRSATEEQWFFARNDLVIMVTMTHRASFQDASVAWTGLNASWCSTEWCSTEGSKENGRRVHNNI